jgi:hypothetical protein
MHGLAHALAQLGDVAGPGLLQQRGAGIRREPDRLDSRLRGEERQEVRRQREHVFASFRERGNHDFLMRNTERRLARAALRRRDDPGAQRTLRGVSLRAVAIDGERAR